MCKVHPTCNPASSPTILKPPPTTLPDHTCDANPLVGSAAHFAHKIRTAPQQETTLRSKWPPRHKAAHFVYKIRTAPQRETTSDLKFPLHHANPLCSQNSDRATMGDHVTIQNCHCATRVSARLFCCLVPLALTSYSGIGCSRPEPWTRLHCSESHLREPVVLSAGQSGAREAAKPAHMDREFLFRISGYSAGPLVGEWRLLWICICCNALQVLC